MKLTQPMKHAMGGLTHCYEGGEETHGPDHEYGGHGMDEQPKGFLKKLGKGAKKKADPKATAGGAEEPKLPFGGEEK